MSMHVRACCKNRLTMAKPIAAESQRFSAQGLADDHIDLKGEGRHLFARATAVNRVDATRLPPGLAI